MDHKQIIHEYISKISDPIFEYIKSEEPSFYERWVPSNRIKNELGLKFLCVPKNNKQYGPKGWFFSIIARRLEEDERIEHKKANSRSFFRTMKP